MWGELNIVGVWNFFQPLSFCGHLILQWETVILFYVNTVLSETKHAASSTQACITVPSHQDAAASSTDVGSHIQSFYSNTQHSNKR